MTRRRTVGVALGMALLLGIAAGAPAQSPPGAPLIGVLALEFADRRHPEVDALLAGLSALGWVDGRTIAIAYAWAGADEAALPALAAGLVARRVKLIVALAPPAVHAAQAAASGMPIVMRTSVDPVRAGFATSLAHPDRNITGVSSASDALYGKRLELLKELVPGLARVGVLWEPDSPTGRDYLGDARAAARVLGLDLVELGVRRQEDLAVAFQSATRAGVQAVLPLRSPLVVRSRRAIARLASEARLPALYDDREYVAAGGLASYGADLAAMHRRAAYFVDRLLKGAQPADLPIEEPTRFELIVNGTAARAIGIDFPPGFIARADEVIE